jgi:rhomboid family GlyGly-CTERM serine protease
MTLPYSILLLAPVIALQAWPGLGDLAQYDRAAIGAGQIWRLLTCHLVHCNWEHLFWDAAVFAGLGTLCERRGRSAWAACCVLSSVTIPLAIMAFQPGITWYRGLSGIDTALFVWLAIDIAGQRWAMRDWTSLAGIGGLLVGLLGKTGYEALSGATIFVDSSAAGFIAVPLAHLIGALVGGLVGVASLTSTYKTGRDESRPVATLFGAQGTG